MTFSSPSTPEESPIEYLELAGRIAGDLYVPVTQEAWQRFSDYCRTLGEDLERKQIDGHLVLPMREAIGATIGAAVATPEERTKMWSAGEQTYYTLELGYLDAIWRGDAAEIADTRARLEEAIAPLTSGGMDTAKTVTAKMYDSCIIAAALVREKGGPFPGETPLAVVSDWAADQMVRLEQLGVSPAGKSH